VALLWGNGYEMLYRRMTERCASRSWMGCDGSCVGRIRNVRSSRSRRRSSASSRFHAGNTESIFPDCPRCCSDVFLIDGDWGGMARLGTGGRRKGWWCGWEKNPAGDLHEGLPVIRVQQRTSKVVLGPRQC
jgi:hypothetical protein